MGAYGRLDVRGHDERITALLNENRELVAAEPRDGIAITGAALQPFRHSHQECVPHAVATGVVDQLEVIEVKEQDRHCPKVSGVQGERMLEPVVEQAAVRETGQPVVERLVTEPSLAVREGPRELADLPETHEPATVRTSVTSSATSAGR